MQTPFNLQDVEPVRARAMDTPAVGRKGSQPGMHLMLLLLLRGVQRQWRMGSERRITAVNRSLSTRASARETSTSFFLLLSHSFTSDSAGSQSPIILALTIQQRVGERRRIREAAGDGLHVDRRLPGRSPPRPHARWATQERISASRLFWAEMGWAVLVLLRGLLNGRPDYLFYGII